MWGRLAISTTPTTPTSPTSDTLTKTSEHGRTCWCSSDMDWQIRDNKPHITYCYCEANLLWRIIVSSYPIMFSLDLLGCVLHAWHISKFDDSIFAYLSSYILCSTLHYKPHNGDCTHRVCYRIYPYTYLKSNPNRLIRVPVFRARILSFSLHSSGIIASGVYEWVKMGKRHGLYKWYKWALWVSVSKCE